MAAYLVDTSVLIGLQREDQRRGGAGELDWILDEGEHVISVVTASELLHGVHRARDDRHRLRRHAFVEQILAKLEPVPITIGIARIHASVAATLDMVGESIDAHDLWIAATALAHDLTVLTHNERHFERVPGLLVRAS